MEGHEVVRWFIPRIDSLLWECWDGEHILFVPMSGETSLVNEMAARVIRLLGERPFTLEELSESLAEEFSVVTEAAFDEAIEATVAQLDELGLAVPLTP